MSFTSRELILDLLRDAESKARDNLARAQYARRGVVDPTKPYGQNTLSIDEIIYGYQQRLRDITSAYRWFNDLVGGPKQ